MRHDKAGEKNGAELLYDPKEDERDLLYRELKQTILEYNEGFQNLIQSNTP